MATLVRALSRIVPSADTESDPFMTVALFCAAGLFVSLLVVSYGVDVSRIFRQRGLVRSIGLIDSNAEQGQATPAKCSAELKYTLESEWLELHESGT